MRTLKRLLAVFLAISMLLFCFTGIANATEEDDSITTNKAALEARNGVLQVAMGVTLEDGTTYAFPVGTGFLLGEEGNAQTLITNYHVLHGNSEDDVRAAFARANIPVAEDSKLKIDYRVIINRDVPILLTIVKESVQSDYAILTLEQPIYDRKPLSLGDSDKVSVTQTVAALGFPGMVQEVQMNSDYSAEDVTITDGIVSKTGEVPSQSHQTNVSTPCIVHSCIITAGNSGGPLIDEKGNVLGINSYDSGSSYFYAVNINELRKTLDALGIRYIDGTNSSSDATDADTSTAAPDGTEAPVETAAPVDKTDLKNKIDEAKAIDGSKYTKESFGALETALENAEASYEDDAESQARVDKRLSELNEAIKNLEEPKGMNMTLIIVIAAIVVVLIILTIVLVVVSRKSKKQQQKTTPPPSDGFAPSPFNIPPQPPVNGFPVNDGADATSVLSEGSSETTVLGGGAAGNAYLIRMKTGEKIILNSPNFTIGKEKRRVNYCISDNSSISRCHARIARKGNQYFIIDMNSTNFTFVNGTKASANVEVPLTDNARIKLSDEDFEFHTA